jgi:hypothetical protein
VEVAYPLKRHAYSELQIIATQEITLLSVNIMKNLNTENGTAKNSYKIQ